MANLTNHRPSSDVDEKHERRRDFNLAAARIMRLAARVEGPATLHPYDGKGENLAFVDDDGEPA